MPRGEGTYGSQVGRPPKNKESLLRKPYADGGTDEPIVEREYRKIRSWFNPLKYDEIIEEGVEDLTENIKERIEDSLWAAKRDKKQEQRKEDREKRIPDRLARAEKKERTRIAANIRQRQTRKTERAARLDKRDKTIAAAKEIAKKQIADGNLVAARTTMRNATNQARAQKRIDKATAKGRTGRATRIGTRADRRANRIARRAARRAKRKGEEEEEQEDDDTTTTQGSFRGGRISKQMGELVTHTMPDGTVMPGATHEEYEDQPILDDQMASLMSDEQIEKEQLPDEQMEEDHVDFIIEATLEEEDQNYLESALAKDTKLSELFDEVIESASEFSGSGPVEGLGSEISDSIPARLSDGEFVITAKATEQIGADNLQQMMEQAETDADKRQSVAYGGVPDKEDKKADIAVSTQGSILAAGGIPPVVPLDPIREDQILSMQSSSPRRGYRTISG